MGIRRRRVIELWVYKHSRQKGIVVRRVRQRDGEIVSDMHKYFAYNKHDGKTGAVEAAIRWKRRYLGSKK